MNVFFRSKKPLRRERGNAKCSKKKLFSNAKIFHSMANEAGFKVFFKNAPRECAEAGARIRNKKRSDEK